MTTTFHEFLRDRCEQGGFTTEDALASFLPLVRQVIETHESRMCAPLEGLGALKVEGVRIWFEESQRCEAQMKPSRLRRLLKPEAKAVEVLSEAQVVHDVDTGHDDVISAQSADRDVDLKRPAWTPGYVCWEHLVGHHDPLTDTFSLGLILASLACGLDLTETDDHKQFVAHRSNLFALTPGLHPVLAKAIRAMTELDRHTRPQDLQSVLRALENYRDQEVDFDTDLAQNRDYKYADRPRKRRIILDKLQERLFEVSRRNRLLHFKLTMQSVNLTHASIPLMFDYRNVREEQILTWNATFSRDLLSGKAVSLNRYLNFREAVYLPGTLDRIRAEGSRDEKEFGFAQLRLVICFLRWANLKEKPVEQYESPLLLLPVRLAVKKGIHDRYSMTALETEAEVNPVVRHLFKQLYEIDLPDRVDATCQGIDEFHKALNARIQASDSSVTLTKVDKPRIDLIHEKARRRLDQFRRRARLSGRGIRKFCDLDYSYEPANYHPLGVRIFEEMVRPAKTHLERVVSSGPPPPHYVVEPIDPPVAEAEGEFYSVRERLGDNPYNWEFDLCSVTLSNLKYRRMSLVRDYRELAEDTSENAAFDATFSISPRDVETSSTDALPLADRYHVVPCDPTQTNAISLARTGASYIIQGPPGTGKSQTITNLIADFVVRGKRVLFVCEKRAAIDVVYHRLKQRGLHELSCLIHDSQADKKEFVMDLKATYEAFLAAAGKKKDHYAARRSKLVEQVERELQPIEAFDAAMRSVPDTCGVPLRSVVGRRIRLSDHIPEFSPRVWERVPFYADWYQHRTQLSELAESMRDVQADGVLANHPLHLLSGKVAASDRPLELVGQSLRESFARLDRLNASFDSFELPPGSADELASLATAVDYATQAAFLARAGVMAILDDNSDTAKQLDRDLKKLRQSDRDIAKKQEATHAWREKLSPEDVETALDQARQFGSGLLSMLNPAWWRLRSVLNRAYEFSQHKVRPSWVRILELLRGEQQAIAKHVEIAEAIRESLGIEEDFNEFESRLSSLRETIAELPESVLCLHESVVTSRDGNDTILALAAISEELSRLVANFDEFIDGYWHRTLPQLADDLRDIEDSLDELPDYLHCLSHLDGVSSALAESLRTLPVTLPAMEAATAERSLQSAWRDHRSVARFNGMSRRRHVSRLSRLSSEWQKSNAECVREFVRQTFIEHVNTASKPAAQLTPQQKDFKKLYNRGRRELQHEFGKSMRYKSIRDLVAGDSGLVVRDLKPVWLMSPLSVSDTLPLATDNFDVVIFDEASQITLEAAVPSIFRAQQTIVVGDEMQLPPTAFFMSRRQEEDEDLLFEENGDLEQYDLDSNSFLNHAARNLKSRMLGWHYRSRSESLISFSNHAFYDGRLLTVPDERLPQRESEELLVTSASDAARFADELLDRPVSFHFIKHGIYEKRRNAKEAAYIAELVRRILEREEGHSIGIVAFSEAQQAEIELALQAIIDEDSEFARRLELELEREEDDQFVGLLVKNLENIQGDERDIIIMSVCYGPTRDGKIRMNFGPINISGGEKRLNVAFSRSRCHMALVSSMRWTSITNDYNDGANCLKNYLRYAEAASIGDAECTSLVLQALSEPRMALESDVRATDAVVQQLTRALEQRGYHVAHGVGQSHFRCDIAVSLPEDSKHRLGILVDTADWYAQHDLLERELMKPDLLRAFGWRIHVVLARDWYEDEVGALERIERLLAGEELDAPDDGDGAPANTLLDIEESEPQFISQSSGEPEGKESVQDASATELSNFDEADSKDESRTVACNEEWSEYLEFIRGGSSKFWEISVNGPEQTVRYGRIGSRGQERTKTFSDGQSALADAQRQVAVKRRKGYQAKGEANTHSQS